MSTALLEGTANQNFSDATLLKWTNDTGADVSVTNGEILGLKSDSGNRVAAMVLSGDASNADNGVIANGESGIVMIRGRIWAQKSITVSQTQCHTCYWDASENEATSVAVAAVHGDFALGMVTEDASTTAHKVVVDLNEGPNAYAMGSSSSSSSSSSLSSSSSSSSSSSLSAT